MEFDESQRESLDRWLRMGAWSKREAMMLLCGADPAKPDAPHMHPLSCFDDFDAADAFEQRQRLFDLWSRDLQNRDSYPPTFFIGWARGKGIEIPWPPQIENIYRGNEAPELNIEAGQGSVETVNQDTSTQTGEIAETGQPINSRAEQSYLRIIAALLEFIEGATPGVEPHPSFINESKLIAQLSQCYRGYGGLSESNLSRKFPEAKRTLQNS